MPIVTTLRIHIRPKSEWESEDPVILTGEAALDKGTTNLKVGIDNKRWSELEYGILLDSTAPHSASHAQGGRDPITPENIGAATVEHTHALEDLGAANKDHTHTPEEIGAADRTHTHTPEDLSFYILNTSFDLDQDQTWSITLDETLGNLHYVHVHLKFEDDGALADAASVAYWTIDPISRRLDIINTYPSTLTFFLSVKN